MKLIVGLGNPGNEYNNTRHNIGFMCLDYYASKHGIAIDNSKFDGLYVKTTINQENVIFLKPQTYMNFSGESVKKVIDYYKIDINDILIISDDLDLEIGKYKLRQSGSSGGHNGLKNIELNIQSQNYKRLKIGISNNKNIDTKDYVLGKISLEENEQFQDVFNICSKIIDDYFEIEFDSLMSKYNHK